MKGIAQAPSRVWIWKTLRVMQAVARSAAPADTQIRTQEGLPITTESGAPITTE